MSNQVGSLDCHMGVESEVDTVLVPKAFVAKVRELIDYQIRHVQVVVPAALMDDLAAMLPRESEDE
jgi:hypothetical protein